MFIKVNEVELYYETKGEGPAFILIHGNGEDHSIFDILSEQLAKDYTVYAIDSRDHGKSSKVKNLDYSEMMEDIALFIDYLNIKNPILYGFSDGGIIGLLMAIKYPKLLFKLIISGANLYPSGIKTIWVILMKVYYFFTKDHKFKLMLTQPDIKETELQHISTPTLVLAGSKDFVKESHTKLIATNIPASKLLILQKENHTSYVVHSEKLYKVIKPFLD